MARFPATHTVLLESYIRHQEGKQRLTEVMIDFIDPNAPEEPIPVAKKPADVIKKEKALADDGKGEEAEDEDEEQEEEDQGPTGPDLEEVAAHFEKLGAHHAKFIQLNDKHGPGHAKAKRRWKVPLVRVSSTLVPLAGPCARTPRGSAVPAPAVHPPVVPDPSSV